ncbi:MAG: 4Fe-4S dicluster domain-containing protein, partial [Adlercreutzia mucosicola]|nr:4Fe-4S dicluster domain-containing protein [Adlercreutzia mucosicola]
FGPELNEYEAVMYEAMPPATMDKCTFCAERVDAGDGRAQACVAACPAGARAFGDLGELKAQAEAAGGYQLKPEEGTNPSVWYLPFNVNE